jgi:hypothetical protein
MAELVVALAQPVAHAELEAALLRGRRQGCQQEKKRCSSQRERHT